MMTAIVEKFLINDELCLLFASVYNKNSFDRNFWPNLTEILKILTETFLTEIKLTETYLTETFGN